MNTYNISRKAEEDIEGIGDFTQQTWGEQQAIKYLEELEECFELLARSPAIGRPCDLLSPGLRRYETGKHVIFFRWESHSLVHIVRVLHQRMLPKYRHFIEP